MKSKDETRKQKILQAAIQVFAEYGYHKAKISKIAEIADVATGSVYRYFNSKEHLLHEIFDQLWRYLVIELGKSVACPDLTAIEKIDALFDLFFDVFFVDNRSLAIVFFNEHNRLLKKGVGDFSQYHEQFLDLIEQAVSEGIQNGLFNPNLDLKVLRYFIFGGMRYLIYQWGGDLDAISLDNMRQSVKFLVKNGIVVGSD